jgi:hypothetical protein
LDEERFQYFIWDDPEDSEGVERLREAIAAAQDETSLDPKAQAGKAPPESDYTRVRLGDEARFAYDPQALEAKTALALTGDDVLVRKDGVHRISIDVPLLATEHLGRRNAPALAGWRDRDGAERLTDAAALRDFAAQGGETVNVVIVDNGFDEGYLRALYGPGPSFAPKTFIQNLPGGVPARRGAPSARHGDMIARNVLAMAPFARLIDMPILPDSVDDVGRFTSDVINAFDSLLDRVKAAPHEAWVIVCAWGVSSRRFETGVQNFSDDPRHILNARIAALVDHGADVVFSAGNNGLMAPDPRSRAMDRGPHLSIFGAAALPDVLTVAACDCQGDWIGVSAQGAEPEPMHRRARVSFRDPAISLTPFDDPRKPDIAAPSWFVERGDRYALSAGTSGACGFTAGFVAAARRRIGPQALPPAKLIDIIRDTARPIGHRGGADRARAAALRQGAGVIDGAALAAALEPLISQAKPKPEPECPEAPGWLERLLRRLHKKLGLSGRIFGASRIAGSFGGARPVGLPQVTENLPTKTQ